MAEESEAVQEIEALKAIWPELQDRPPVWNSPAVAVPVCPLGMLACIAADQEFRVWTRFVQDIRKNAYVASPLVAPLVRKHVHKGLRLELRVCHLGRVSCSTIRREMSMCRRVAKKKASRCRERVPRMRAC